MNKKLKPLYQHDCKECHFVGVSKNKVDLYFCKRDLIPVVRRSDYGSD